MIIDLTFPSTSKAVWPEGSEGSKLQYKAEDLPLAECQVYARLPPTPPLPLLPPFLSIVPFPTAQPKKKENKSF